MTPEQIEKERVRFEAWVKVKFPVLSGLLKSIFERDKDGDYINDWTLTRWEGWLARAELSIQFVDGGRMEMMPIDENDVVELDAHPEAPC